MQDEKDVVSNDMLAAAMKEAVRQGIFPKYGFVDQVSDAYDKLKAVLVAAIEADQRK